MADPSLLWTFLPLMPFKLRNAALDCLFYDVGALTPTELAYLTWIDANKGSVVVVPPRSGGSITYYPQAARFIIKELPFISTVVVAGVGSSIVGAAALARNVADARNQRVAAIISGYGVADVLDEALGGWFLFGNADRFRRQLDRIFYGISHPWSTRPPRRGEVTLPTDIFDPSSPGFGLPGDEDAVTLSNIFLAQPEKLDLLVGHSKGSLIIDAALVEYQAALGDIDALTERLRVVTLSAVADIPSDINAASLRQFIGGWDWFGWLNSDFDIKSDRVGLAWHHLNQMLPFHLNAVETVRNAVAGWEEPQRSLKNIRLSPPLPAQ